MKSPQVNPPPNLAVRLSAVLGASEGCSFGAAGWLRISSVASAADVNFPPGLYYELREEGKVVDENVFISSESQDSELHDIRMLQVTDISISSAQQEENRNHV